MAGTRVGISGWSYPGWRGGFYPEDLAVRKYLSYASRQFNSIELNASFYGLQRPASYRRWYEETPVGFVFAVKGSRFITHNKKLDDIDTPLANFFASGVLLLEEKLGPILWQLSGNLRFREDRVARFLDLLPRDTFQAVRLARRHDARMRGRSWTKTTRNRRIRHAIEPRNESFLVPEFARLCRRHGVAIAVSDAADWPRTEEITAGFVYIRLHGSAQTYASRYSDAELDEWARRIRAWQSGRQPADARTLTTTAPPPRRSRDVYAYFDNDALGHAPLDAQRLAQRLGIDLRAAA